MSRAVSWVLTIALLLCLVIPGFIAFRVWHVARIDDRTPADAIVVLGAAQYNGVPTPVFQARLEHAALLYDEGVAPQIITVGGGQPGDLYTEAGSGRAYLTRLGVPPEAVLAVETGTNTEGSLDAVAQTVRDQGGQSVVLVSDPTHSYRSRMMARDAGLDAWTSPTRHGPAVWTRENQIMSIIRETGAVLWYQYHRIAGSDVDFPG
ncbi:YdcF family protein [Dietzia cinnamea]|uniref:YdcF family protein n=1 Tax=Dietzia cinnamea TaxID=321318 RepID=A0ABV3YK43_9ACTN|nr:MULTISPECIES: YdcF family protein [Dietzia]AVM64925.1 YdcF family protein [Dietzia sp. oral taxon 368]MCT1711601.1 YdcF family protein [Dietzia cinnamea]MCT1886501.1 YdcF family protein [Dietzia cinnamea]MCT2120681.1 YdcF family protein [Dietzia cinnamea]MCT2140350.1 YdcF family protein [Dietzia cinnamea]